MRRRLAGISCKKRIRDERNRRKQNKGPDEGQGEVRPWAEVIPVAKDESEALKGGETPDAGSLCRLDHRASGAGLKVRADKTDI